MFVQRTRTTGEHSRIVSNSRGSGIDLDLATCTQAVVADVEGLHPICNNNIRCTRANACIYILPFRFRFRCSLTCMVLTLNFRFRGWRSLILPNHLSKIKQNRCPLVFLWFTKVFVGNMGIRRCSCSCRNFAGAWFDKCLAWCYKMPRVLKTKPWAGKALPWVLKTEPWVFKTKPWVFETEPWVFEPKPSVLKTKPWVLKTEP